MSRIVLGVSGGVAAYKAALRAARLHRGRARRPRRPDPRRPALRRRGHLRGAVGQPGHHRRLVRRPRGRPRAHRAERRPRRRRAGHRRPAGPRRHGPGRRPAHRHAAHRVLSGGLRARDAHRDVAAPGHAGERRHAAPPRRRRPAARRRPADRPRLRARPAARAGRHRRAGRPSSCTTGRPPLAHDLAGRRVVISAGGTREPLDPVRYLGNRSSGRQGWALARVAAARGAEVVLVARQRRAAGAVRGPRRPGRDGRGAADGDARRGRRRPTSS